MDRLLNILKLVDLQSRLLTNSADIKQLLKNPIDYSIVNNKLSKMRVASLKFIEENL